MQTQVNIEFDLFVEIAKQLPITQWTKLKKEVEEKGCNAKQNLDLVSLFLLTFSVKTWKKEIIISQN